MFNECRLRSPDIRGTSGLAVTVNREAFVLFSGNVSLPKRNAKCNGCRASDKMSSRAAKSDRPPGDAADCNWVNALRVRQQQRRLLLTEEDAGDLADAVSTIEKLRNITNNAFQPLLRSLVQIRRRLRGGERLFLEPN